jgi:hypothetical protein
LTINYTWRFSLNRHLIQVALDGALPVDWLAERIHDAAQHALSGTDGRDASCTLH